MLGGVSGYLPRSPNPPPQGCPGGTKISLELPPPLIVNVSCVGGRAKFCQTPRVYAHSTHTRSSCLEADDSAQRDYYQPIHSQNVIPNNYDRYNDNGK